MSNEKSLLNLSEALEIRRGNNYWSSKDEIDNKIWVVKYKLKRLIDYTPNNNDFKVDDDGSVSVKIFVVFRSVHGETPKYLGTLKFVFEKNQKGSYSNCVIDRVVTGKTPLASLTVADVDFAAARENCERAYSVANSRIKDSASKSKKDNKEKLSKNVLSAFDNVWGTCEIDWINLQAFRSTQAERGQKTQKLIERLNAMTGLLMEPGNQSNYKVLKQQAEEAGSTKPPLPIPHLGFFLLGILMMVAMFILMPNVVPEVSSLLSFLSKTTQDVISLVVGFSGVLMASVSCASGKETIDKRTEWFRENRYLLDAVEAVEKLQAVLPKEDQGLRGGGSQQIVDGQAGNNSHLAGNAQVYVAAPVLTGGTSQNNRSTVKVRNQDLQELAEKADQQYSNG